LAFAPGIKWKFVEANAALYETLKPKLPFGSLPLLEIDGLELVQPGSIVRYKDLHILLTHIASLTSSHIVIAVPHRAIHIMRDPRHARCFSC